MSLSQLEQLQRLLGDIRGLSYDSTLLTLRLTRAQAEIAETYQAFEKRATLSLTAGVSTYAVPSDWLQTFAVLRVATPVSGTVVTPLVRLEAEGLAQVDPRRTPGAPRYYTLEGTTLVIDPVPDATYSAEHWYYTTDSAQVGTEWRTPVLLHALASLLPQSQPWEAALQVESWAQQEGQHLARLSSADERDALEALRQPAT